MQQYPTLRSMWLLCLGVAWLVLGMSLISDVAPYGSSSFVWIFYYVPQSLWGLIYMTVGLLSISSSTVHSDGRRGQVSFALNSLIAFMWCAGFAAAWVTGDLRGSSGIPIWGLIAAWNLLVARSSDDSKAMV